MAEFGHDSGRRVQNTEECLQDLVYLARIIQDLHGMVKTYMFIAELLCNKLITASDRLQFFNRNPNHASVAAKMLNLFNTDFGHIKLDDEINISTRLSNVNKTISTFFDKYGDDIRHDPTFFTDEETRLSFAECAELLSLVMPHFHDFFSTYNTIKNNVSPTNTHSIEELLNFLKSDRIDFGEKMQLFFLKCNLLHAIYINCGVIDYPPSQF